jgi:hypothetical protein
LEKRRNLTCVEAHCTGALDFKEKLNQPIGVWRLKSKWIYDYIERKRNIKALEYVCAYKQAPPELHEQLAALLLPGDGEGYRSDPLSRFGSGAAVDSFNPSELEEIYKAYIERAKKVWTDKPLKSK